MTYCSARHARRLASPARPAVLGALLAVLASAAAAPARALVPVSPTSYDMINGGSGSFNYWDEKYSGTGNTALDYAALSGGLGDLTDGIIAEQNWNATEALAGPGPYVGWLNRNPTITFQFASLIDFQAVTIHFDDSQTGGVTAPVSVAINGVAFTVTDPPGTSPFAAQFDITSFAPTDQLAIQLNQGAGGWVFASEFQFTAVASASVPESGTLALLLLAALVAVAARRRRAAA